MCCFWGHLLEANGRSLLRFLDLGMEETSEPTLFRVYFKKSFFLLLIYVDDLCGLEIANVTLRFSTHLRHSEKASWVNVATVRVESGNTIANILTEISYGLLALCPLVQPFIESWLDAIRSRRLVVFLLVKLAPWGFWEEWFELRMEEAWSYVSNHLISTTLRRALGESLKVINPPPNLVRFEQQGQEISTSSWTFGLVFPHFACPVFPYIVAGKLSVESHFGWWTWFLVPKAWASCDGKGGANS